MPENKNNNAFTITRVLDAPRDLVFHVWTETNHLKNWISPKGFSVRYLKSEIKPGGVSHYCMTSPEGSEIWGKILYRDIIKPDRLVYIQYFSDEKGLVARHPMSSTWPLEMLTTVNFEDNNGKTKLTLRWDPINATEEELITFNNGRDGMTLGWGGSFEQLDNYLRNIKS
jgi:uncharacterized protein YndB with AHSA1/START domain